LRRLTQLVTAGVLDREEAGQGLAEYALILALIAIVAILSIIFLGDTLADLLSVIGDTIQQNT
jgi:Flp pilus assembly pilin Flp